MTQFFYNNYNLFKKYIQKSTTYAKFSGPKNPVDVLYLAGEK